MKEQRIQGHRLLFKALVGSQAYGTATPASDEDFKGIYMQSIHEILNGKYKQQITVTDDEVYYEINRFMGLLESNNPTIIEMLNTPENCIIYKDPILDELFENRDKFLTKKCRFSFGGYAVQQIKKAKGLNKNMNMEKESVARRTPLDFCYIYIGNEKSIPLRKWLEIKGYDHTKIGLAKINNFDNAHSVYVHDTMVYKGIVKMKDGVEVGNEVRISSIPKGEESIAMMKYNVNGYKSHCKKYNFHVKWLKERNTARYVDIEGHGQQIDGKNMLHCRRLIDMAIEIAKGEGVNVYRSNAEYLLSIRKGKVDLQSLLDNAESDLAMMDKAFEDSELPEGVETGLKDRILKNIRDYQLEYEYGKNYYLKQLSNMENAHIKSR